MEYSPLNDMKNHTLLNDNIYCFTRIYRAQTDVSRHCFEVKRVTQNVILIDVY